MRMTKRDYVLLATFRRQIRIFFAFSQNVAEATGLPVQQYQALLAIKGHVGRSRMAIGELAKDLMVEQPGASALVDRLVGRELLIRIADKRDRRRILLALTPKAEKILATMATTHLEELRRMQPTLIDLFEQFGRSSRTSGDLQALSVSQRPEASPGRKRLSGAQDGDG